MLDSIYEGDNNFKKVDDKTFRYLYEHESSSKSFLLEITWGENYPEERPKISLNAFFNKHIIDQVTITEKLTVYEKSG